MNQMKPGDLHFERYEQDSSAYYRLVLSTAPAAYIRVLCDDQDAVARVTLWCRNVDVDALGEKISET